MTTTTFSAAMDQPTVGTGRAPPTPAFGGGNPTTIQVVDFAHTSDEHDERTSLPKPQERTTQPRRFRVGGEGRGRSPGLPRHQITPTTGTTYSAGGTGRTPVRVPPHTLMTGITPQQVTGLN